MENLSEYIVPVIFVVIYVLNMLTKAFGRKDESQDEGSAPPPELPYPGSFSEADEEARAEQLREEIRRKIEERRRKAAGAGQPASAPTPERPAQTRPQTAAARERTERQQSMQEIFERTRREIRRTEEAAEAIRKSKAKAAKSSAYDLPGAAASYAIRGSDRQPFDYAIEAPRRRPAAAQAAIAALKNARSAKTGIILREILDKPLGLRFGTGQDRLSSF